jgi:hypothetical protein
VPVTWQMEGAADMVRVRYTEPYSFDDWQEVLEELRDNPIITFRRQIGGLIDRAGVGPPDQAFIRQVADYMSTHSVLMRRRRLAFVVRDKECARSVWLLAMVYEEAGAISAVFSSEPEACAWLREA